MRRERYIAWGLLMPSLVILLTVGIFPLVYSLWLSQHSYSLLDPARGFRYVGAENFRKILAGEQALGISFTQSLRLTLIFVGSCLFLEVGLGLGIATLLSKKSLYNLQPFRVMMMIPMLVVPVAVGNIWKYMYQETFGLINFLLRLAHLPTPGWLSTSSWAIIALIITNVWEWMPFSFLVLFAAICSVPDEQLEAASIDGAGSWKRFLYIILPGVQKAILVVLLIRAIELIKKFDLVYVLAYGGPGTATSILPFNAYVLGFKFFEIGEGAAYSYFMVALINVIALSFISILRREMRHAY